MTESENAADAYFVVVTALYRNVHSLTVNTPSEFFNGRFSQNVQILTVHGNVHASSDVSE